MEDDYKVVLKGLKSKIELIISKYESSQAANAILSERLALCKQNFENSNNKVKELEQKIDNLQMIEAFKSSAEDVKDAKCNISKLIKEIDKCLALLND
jgi:cell fate (sporulation/competence/biofilm development) regulator YmcA (YheA/YmcA/DUF963 family)